MVYLYKQTPPTPARLYKAAGFGLHCSLCGRGKVNLCRAAFQVLPARVNRQR